MSEKEGKKKTIKNNKKVSKDKKTITLKLNNGVEIPAKNIYKEDLKIFNINDIDIDKIRVSDKKLYDKKHNSYKHYVFYEDGNEYISLKITLLDVLGYYNTFEADSKTMKFKLDDNSLEKIKIPDEKTKYNCRVLLQIQSVYCNNKDVLEDEDYYPQVLLQSCRYTFIDNNKLIHEALDFTDTVPESQSEEEFNEDTT